MAQTKWTIEEVNKRLKSGKVGVMVAIRGDRLSLRATFPPKPGIEKSPHQQYLALGIYANPAGLQQAEAEAKRIGGMLAQGKFNWSEYLGEELRPVGSAQSWITKFETDYYARKGKSPITECTWKSDYLPAWKLLEGELTPESIVDAIAKVPVNTRKRKLMCEKLASLAKFAGLVVDLKPYIGNYGLEKSQPRHIPTTLEIEASRELFAAKPDWQWAYGVLAAYGLRPHEVFFCKIDPTYPHILKVFEGKTGYREVYPYHVRWAVSWELWNQPKMPDSQAKTLKVHGQRICKVFARRNLTFTAYCLRHAYCIRLATEYKIPVAIAANWAGHEPGVYLKIYQRWIGEAEKRRVFDESIKV
jgi:integrase